MNWILNYAWAIIWAILMCVLMFMPATELPSGNYFCGSDKMVHCGSFYLLTTLMLFGSAIQTKRRAVKMKTMSIVFFIAILFVAITELGQMYLTSTRQADWWDVFADMVGIGMALFSFLLFYSPRAQYQ
ncbi:MAG: VanZ family protein [Sphingobacterium hotanense]